MRVRMSVARCCCSYCTTNHETSYSDSFTTSIDAGWTQHPTTPPRGTWSISGGRLRLVTNISYGLGDAQIRSHKFDPTVHTSIEQESDLFWNQINCSAGIELFRSLSAGRVGLFANPYKGTPDYSYSYHDGTSAQNGTIATTPVSGDTLKIVADLTNWDAGTTTCTFDVELFINAVSKATFVHKLIVDPCNCVHSVVGSYTGGFVSTNIEWDDYSLTTT